MEEASDEVRGGSLPPELVRAARIFEFDYLLEIDISSQIQAIWFKVQLWREIGKLDCCDFRDKMFLLPLESLLSQE